MPLNRAALMCLAAVMTAGCGGPAEEPSAVEPSALETTSQAAYPEYDPELHCQVWGRYVDCGPGRPTMYSYYSDTYGYYIERFVCGNDRPVCPYY